MQNTIIYCQSGKIWRNFVTLDRDVISGHRVCRLPILTSDSKRATNLWSFINNTYLPILTSHETTSHMPFVTSKIVKRVEANYKLKRRLNFLSEVWIRISRKDGKKNSRRGGHFHFLRHTKTFRFCQNFNIQFFLHFVKRFCPIIPIHLIRL